MPALVSMLMRGLFQQAMRAADAAASSQRGSERGESVAELPFGEVKCRHDHGFDGAGAWRGAERGGGDPCVAEAVSYNHPEQVARETAACEGVVAYFWKGSDAYGEARQNPRGVFASPGGDEFGA
eukprot:3796660-Heterocapsa_arctica.AAC.1